MVPINIVIHHFQNLKGSKTLLKFKTKFHNDELTNLQQ